MKKVDLKEMEILSGGDLLDGACAIIGFADLYTATYATLAKLGVRIATASVSGWGLIALGVGTIACVGRQMELY